MTTTIAKAWESKTDGGNAEGSRLFSGRFSTTQTPTATTRPQFASASSTGVLKDCRERKEMPWWKSRLTSFHPRRSATL